MNRNPYPAETARLEALPRQVKVYALHMMRTTGSVSRLNRAYPGKDTTYVLDFVNEPKDVLAAFKTYHETAELAATTEPNLVFNLRAKLGAAGHYDDFEVDRVVAVELKPDAKQGELVAALEPVRDRLMKRYMAAQAALKVAKDKQDEKSAKTAQDELSALLLKSELLNAIMGALDAHTSMSTQALNSDTVQRGIKDILLNNARLWETLRDQVA